MKEMCLRAVTQTQIAQIYSTYLMSNLLTDRIQSSLFRSRPRRKIK